MDRGSIGARHTLGDPQTVLVIDIVDGEFRSALLCLSQPPSVPLEVPPGAVVVARRVSDGILESAMEAEASMALVVLRVLPLGSQSQQGFRNILGKCHGSTTAMLAGWLAGNKQS